jgi:hypothetical protein
MIATRTSLRKRLQFILHRGFTEARNLALARNHEQIFELADAMEILPRYLDECGDDDLEMIRFVLKNYLSKYPQCAYGYLEILDGIEEPPARY